MTTQTNNTEHLKIKAEIEANNKKAKDKLSIPYAERLIMELKGGKD